MSDTNFDPSTADNPFAFRVPDVPRKATTRERQVIERYIRISYIIVDGVPDATIVWLNVGSQWFRIGSHYWDTREEAGQACLLLATALVNLLDKEAAHDQASAPPDNTPIVLLARNRPAGDQQCNPAPARQDADGPCRGDS